MKWNTDIKLRVFYYITHFRDSCWNRDPILYF